MPSHQTSPFVVRFQHSQHQSDLEHTLFTGDWAGNSYAYTECPGTCADRLIDPANFVVRLHPSRPLSYLQLRLECLMAY